MRFVPSFVVESRSPELEPDEIGYFSGAVPERDARQRLCGSVSELVASLAERIQIIKRFVSDSLVGPVMDVEFLGRSAADA